MHINVCVVIAGFENFQSQVDPEELFRRIFGSAGLGGFGFSNQDFEESLRGFTSSSEVWYTENIFLVAFTCVFNHVISFFCQFYLAFFCVKWLLSWRMKQMYNYIYRFICAVLHKLTLHIFPCNFCILCPIEVKFSDEL